jgi:two-component system sensor histidine kinase/response regulator
MIEQRILVVEDHEALLAAIQDILETEGYTVLTATDGLQALQVMEKTPPDLIVADIMMPRMDGHAFYEAVRGRPEWVPIPFIFLTAKAEREDVLKGKRLGAEDYLTKPFDPQELAIAVRARLERAQAIRKTTEAEFEKLKNQITTILGHELRTPLTYVLGYTDLALDDAASLSPEDLQEVLQGVKRGADRLTRLVEDLLFLVRLDTGQAREEFHLLGQARRDFGAIVERTVHQYEELAAERSVILETEIAPDLPAVQLCEPFFVDALSRLLDNGIKFSKREGGQVTVSVEAKDKWVEVAVQDKGVGIAAEEIPHLFERFRQIGRDEMEQQGTGLGLATAQELARLHDGEITVDSKPGEGSIFTIRLPVATSAT